MDRPKVFSKELLKKFPETKFFLRASLTNFLKQFLTAFAEGINEGFSEGISTKNSTINCRCNSRRNSHRTFQRHHQRTTILRYNEFATELQKKSPGRNYKRKLLEKFSMRTIEGMMRKIRRTRSQLPKEMPKKCRSVKKKLLVESPLNSNELPKKWTKKFKNYVKPFFEDISENFHMH